MVRVVTSVNNLRRQSRFDHDESDPVTRTHSRISTVPSLSGPEIYPYKSSTVFKNRRPPSQFCDKVEEPPLELVDNMKPISARKYCCSDSSQVESKIWAIFDIVCACLILIVLTYFLITLKTDRGFLEAIVEQNKDNERDLKRFLSYSPIKQDLVMTVVIVREFISVLLGALLYVSAQKRGHHQLRIWLGSTFVAIIVDLFLFIPKMTFTQNKFVYVSTMIGYFLYKWYEVWMVTVLFREIRQNEADSLVSETNHTFDHTEGREYDDRLSEMEDHMGIILSQPPKRNKFRTNPVTDITIVQTKSPVQVEQLHPIRY